MKTLIVGCGYVGLALAEELLRRGHQVRGLRRGLAGLEPLRAAGIEPIQADIMNPASLAILPADHDWVVNCAAPSAGTPEDYRRLYVDGNRNLLNWLRQRPPAKYVYTSSTGVYGQDDGSWVSESDPTEPLPETSRRLVEAERLLLDAARERRFPAVILRVAGIYGPGRGYYHRQILSGEARIEGDGTRHVNMVHRDDVVGAILAALEHSAPGEVYNVCDDEPVAIAELYRWLAQQLGKPFPPSIPPGGGLAQRRGATNKRIANAKLKQTLGYRFRYPTFREGYGSGLLSQ